MQFKKYHIITAIVLVLTVSACKTRSNATISKTSNPEKRYAVTSVFIDAKRAVFNGNKAEAIDLFKKVLNLDPENHAACYELSRLLPKTDINSALEYGKKASDLEPSNKWYLLNLADLYSFAGETKNAASTLNKLIEKNPDNINNYYRLVNLYVKSNDYDNALKTYAVIENHFGFDEKNSLRKKELYLKTGNYRKAEKEMRTLIEHNSGEKKYYGMLADILMKEGKTTEAVKYYNKILEIDPYDGQVHIVLSAYYNSVGKKQESFDEMKKAFANKQLSVDSKVKIMMKFYKITSDFPDDITLKKQADTLLNILGTTHLGNPKVMAMKGDYLVREKKWDEAEKVYNQVIAVDSSRYPVWEQLILIARERGDYPKMQNYTRRALLMFPQYAIVYYFNALACYKIGDYTEADAGLNLGLNFVYKPVQKAEFYTLMGIVRDSLHHYKEAEIAYERALMAVPNDTSALRAYALHFVLTGTEPEKAETLARKSLELNYKSVENHYVYARVLYSQKKYTEAENWAEKGLKLNENHKNLNLLMALILEKEGKPEEAKKYLNNVEKQ